MHNLASAVIATVMMWCLLYLGGESAPSPWSPVLWVVAVLGPSGYFWFLARKGRRPPGESGRRLVAFGWSFVAVVALPLSFALGASRQNANPAWAAVAGAIYAMSLVFALGVSVQSPRMRGYIVENRLLGPLTFGVSASTAAVMWAVGSLLRTGTTVGPFGSVVLDVFCLMVLLLAFLCLLNTSRFQAALGVGSLVALALIFLSPVAVFFSIWLNGVVFWPLIIFSSLAVEAILFRFVRRPVI